MRIVVKCLRSHHNVFVVQWNLVITNLFGLEKYDDKLKTLLYIYHDDEEKICLQTLLCYNVTL